MVQSQIPEHAGLDLYLLRVSLPLDFIPGFELLAGHHACAFEHLHAFVGEIIVIDKRCACLAVQASAHRFRLPLVAVAVSVKPYRLAHPDIFLDDAQYRRELFFACGNAFVHR